MTIEGGSKPKSVLANDGPMLDRPPPEFAASTWETRRMPDPIRAAALANAVDLVSNWTWEKPGPAILGGPREIAGVVLDLAAMFEIYLADEEAH